MGALEPSAAAAAATFAPAPLYALIVAEEVGYGVVNAVAAGSARGRPLVVQAVGYLRVHAAVIVPRAL